tara:strand:- start:3373 stop:3594 length:222 start_codon:yes stop_codon:yes gene_type:complete
METIKQNKPINNIQDDIKVILYCVDNIQNNINDLKAISQDIKLLIETHKNNIKDIDKDKVDKICVVKSRGWFF